MDDLVTMTTKVTSLMASKYKSNIPHDEEANERQIVPSTEHKLRWKIKFSGPKNSDVPKEQ